MYFLTHTLSKHLYATVFLIFGLLHLAMGSQMASSVPIPGGVFWVYFTGVAMAATAVAIYSNRLAGLATFLLGVLLLIFVFTIHLPGLIGGDQMAFIMLLKDTALAAGAWVLSGTYAQEPLPV